MWEIIKNKIKNANMAQWCFGFLGWMTLALLIFLIFGAICSDKRVRGYYLRSQATHAGIAYIIMADIEWFEDTAAFSSPDPKVTMEVFKQLQQIPPAK